MLGEAVYSTTIAGSHRFPDKEFLIITRSPA